MSLDATLELDDSSLGNDSDFNPVRPGGHKLDETVDLVSDDSISQDNDISETTQYATTMQSPASASMTSFQTPAMNSTRLTDQPDANSTFLPSTPHILGHSLRVVGSSAPREAHELHDEFHDELHNSQSTMKSFQSTLTEENDSAIASAADPVVPAGNGCDDDETSSSGDQSDLEDNGDAELQDLVSSPKRRRVSDPDLPSTCTVLRSSTPSGGTVYLVGTAHFSRESQDDVVRTIRAVQPDVVVLELCSSRTNILSMDEKVIMEEVSSMTMNKMLDILKQQGVMQGSMYLLLLRMSAHLTKELGMSPGGEFRAAYIEALKVPGCVVNLGDRPFQITLSRAFASLNLWQKIKLGVNFLLSKEKVTKEDVEKCKQKDMLESMMEEMAGEFPAMKQVFVDERDKFLAYSLHMAADPHTALRFRFEQARRSAASAASCCERASDSAPVVVGVVGMGHVPGIKDCWEKVTAADVKQVMQIPKPTLTSVVLRKTVRLAFYGLVLYGGYRVLRRPVGRIFKL